MPEFAPVITAVGMVVVVMVILVLVPVEPQFGLD